MECNKDEASRAKEIAEKKFTARDIVSAKKFALKAQNLYPALEGINQMLATLDVYLSAEKKINGEADWYSILNVDPRADEDTLRKQYRKLALVLHPDKNKSIGADGAFKLISEAWSLLSDQVKRLAYDSKSKATIYQKVSTSTGSSSGKSWVKGFNDFTKFTTTKVKIPKSTTQSGTASAVASQKVERSTSQSGTASAVALQKVERSTFWTVCYDCKLQYEYPKAYLNHNLLCPSCNNAFVAVETPPPPPIASKLTPLKISQQRKNLSNQAGDKDSINRVRNTSKSSKSRSYDQSTFRWNPFSKASIASPAAQSVSMVQQGDEKEREERQKMEEALLRKHHTSKKTSDISLKGSPPLSNRKRVIDLSTSACGNGGTSAMEIETQAENSSVFLPCILTKNKINASSNPSTVVDVPNLLMKKARREIKKKLNEWESAAPATTVTKEWNRSINLNGEKDKILEHSDTDNYNILDLKNVKVASETFSETSGPNGDTKILEPKLMHVPDSDFHDFDKDRTENSFGENQVWAAYDDDDGMPRYYAMIHNVLSLNPFKIQISWLNSKSNSQFGPLNWISSGFPKTCGDFRLGKYEKYRLLNSFSHKVTWTKGARGAIQIYPMKGDVWALYKNWSPDWNVMIADEVMHSYEMVEVLEDYNEEIGITIIPLEKVTGFRTVYRRCLEPTEIRRIPREEMFRFSHSVPSYLLTGKEASNAPKGCRELDPAAATLDVVLGTAEPKEINIVGNEPDSEESSDNNLRNVSNQQNNCS